MIRKVTDEQLAEFLEFAQQASNADYFKFMPDSMDMAPILEFSNITGNTKYVRIFTDRGTQKMSWGFIKLDTGEVLKCDGWKKPALNFARGNIFEPDHGLSGVYWTGIR